MAEMFAIRQNKEIILRILCALHASLTYDLFVYDIIYNSMKIIIIILRMIYLGWMHNELITLTIFARIKFDNYHLLKAHSWYSNDRKLWVEKKGIKQTTNSRASSIHSIQLMTHAKANNNNNNYWPFGIFGDLSLIWLLELLSDLKFKRKSPAVFIWSAMGWT